MIPAGKFMMGSPESEKGRVSDEGPQHEVTIARPLAVGKFAVTFSEWDACTAAGACPTANEAAGGGNGPVINVSWDDAKQYVTWLSRVSGKPYRLLSEAEWEYAARAGTTRPITGATNSSLQRRLCTHSGPFPPMLLATTRSYTGLGLMLLTSTVWCTMFGNGSKTVPDDMKAPLPTARRMQLKIAVPVPFAAARGSAIQLRFSVSPTATATRRTLVAATLASASQGR